MSVPELARAVDGRRSAARETAWGRGAAVLAGVARFVRRKPLGAIGAFIVVAMLLMAVFAEHIAPYGYDETIRGARMKSPSFTYWLGTDNLGRDLWSRIVFGAKVELEDHASGDTVRYQIVGDLEADIKKGLISVSSPVARALIGKSEGDIVEFQAPAGMRKYEIVAVSYAA